MNKQEIKRYLVSSLITFIATFLLVFLPQVSDLTLESIKTGAVLGLLITALRAGVKASIEILIPYIKSLLVK
jgi:hypothetical protein